MKLRDKKVIILGSLVLFILSLFKKNDYECKDNNYAIAVPEDKTIEDVPGVSDTTDNNGVTDYNKDKIAFLDNFSLKGYSYGDVPERLRFVYGGLQSFSAGYKLGKSMEVSDLSGFNSGFGSTPFVGPGVVDFDILSDGVSGINEESQSVDSRIDMIMDSLQCPRVTRSDFERGNFEKCPEDGEIDGLKFKLNNGGFATAWDLVPLVDSFGRCYDGSGGLPYIPQGFIFGSVPFGVRLVAMPFNPDWFEDDDDKSFWDNPGDYLLPVFTAIAGVIHPVFGALAGVIQGMSSYHTKKANEELISALKEVVQFCGAAGCYFCLMDAFSAVQLQHVFKVKNFRDYQIDSLQVFYGGWLDKFEFPYCFTTVYCNVKDDSDGCDIKPDAFTAYMKMPVTDLVPVTYGEYEETNKGVVELTGYKYKGFRALKYKDWLMA